MEKIDTIKELVNNDVSKEDNRKRKLEEIIKMIEETPYLLEHLDIEKLEIINDYYKKEIAECKRKIANDT